jgi:SET domain-containing protein
VSDLLQFKPSSIHGMGAFAAVPIVKGSLVIEYIGQKITKAESLRRCEKENWFIFALDDTYDLDGAVGWNPARFINHSCAPNCDAELIDGHIWIIARRDIAPGEEITFNYGYDLDAYQEHPCQCGAPGCVGYIVAEELMDEVRQKEARKQHKSKPDASR